MTTTAAERLQALRRCEWAADNAEPYTTCCPTCSAYKYPWLNEKQGQHAPGCLLARMIAEAEAEATAHPFSHLAGKYADEPLWDELMETIKQAREREDAEEEEEPGEVERLRAALQEIADGSLGTHGDGDTCWSCEEKVELARRALAGDD